MARGNTLLNIRNMLKAEIGDYSGTNTNADAELNTLLSNKQLWLATEYAWPFLERRWDVVVTPGQQFVNLPTVDDANVTATLNFNRMPSVQVHYNLQYYPVTYGIGSDQYNMLDFTLGQQADPIMRWRLASNPDETSNPNQFEVWPVPTVQQTIRFIGQRVPFVLVQDTDKADMDDILLVYLVAADRLARLKQPDAALMLSKAQRVLANQRQVYPTKDKVRILGGGTQTDGSRPPEGIKLVAIH